MLVRKFSICSKQLFGKNVNTVREGNGSKKQHKNKTKFRGPFKAS